MTAEKYHARPVIIEAMQWSGLNSDEIVQWAQGGWRPKGMWLKQKSKSLHEHIWSLVIPTLEGDMEAAEGDFIIKGTQGEFYPCKPDIFRQKYVKAGP